MLTSNATHSNASANSSSSSTDINQCMETRVGGFLALSFTITRSCLIVPLCTLILYLGLQRWRMQRSFSAASHSDVFTYNIAAIELLATVGVVLIFWDIYAGLPEAFIFGTFLSCMVFSAQVAFHILTCVERYLAVVHPVTYRELRQSAGVKVRNICVACVWLLCFGWGGLSVLYLPNLPTEPLCCLLVLTLIVVTFCSLRVLCVLIRPGPGDKEKEKGETGGKGRDKERVDQSKQRAFHTVVAIMGVLWLWFLGFLVCVVLEGLSRNGPLDRSIACAVLLFTNWFNLPCSLVLPVLFLHKAGKLSCCRGSHE